MRSFTPPKAARQAALLASLCASLALPLPTSAQAASPLSLDDAVHLAVTRSRAVAAAEAQVDAAHERAVAAGQRPDPVLRLGLNNLPIDGPERGSLTRDFMTMRSVGLMQELTRADKRRSRAAIASADGQVAAASERELIAATRRDAALAWLERSYQTSLRELLQAQAVQAEQQVQAEQAQYRGGRRTQTDVFAARTEVEVLRDRLDQVDRDIAVATTRLARWLGPVAEQALAPRPAFARPPWTSGDLSAHLFQHPDIAVAAEQEALAQTQVAAARANQHADWSVELMLSQRGPSYSRMASLNLSLPLQWNPAARQDRDLAAAAALARAASAAREDRERMHVADVLAMLQEWHSHEQRLARYDASLLPLSTQRSAAALASYRAGQGDLTAVLQARRAELDAQSERLRIEWDVARLWAKLNYLMPRDGERGSSVDLGSPQ